MRILFILFIFLFSSYTNLANSKTKSEDDALRSLCNIGKNADGKIWGNSRINKAIQILKNGEIISTKQSFLKSYSYKTCNLDRYL
jgi:hypothetical protein|tara:strand:+ start:364 stop:618 length:255 start_codon:yes stop_codon:yes gene_type:complete